MIRVTVELVSAVDPSRDRLLGVAHIANVSMAPGPHADYQVWLSKWAPKEAQRWKDGRVAIALEDDISRGEVDGTIRGFDKVHRGAWDLIYLCLRAVIGDRNP